MPPREQPTTAEPRRHAYLFAHLRLRQLVLSDSTRFVAAVTDPGFLPAAWAAVASDVPAEHRLDPTGLSGHVTGAPGEQIAVVRLPTPQVASECYFVGALEGVAAMLTLELVRDEAAGRWSTVLGRWDAQGHSLLGYDEPVDGAHFARLVTEHLPG